MWLKSDEKYNYAQIISVYACIAFSYLITTPPIYKYGVGNQASQLPLVKHAMDPSYLANDWVVGLRSEIISPRYFYTETLAAISEITGLSAAVFILYTASLITIISGIWLFIDEIFDDKLAATITVGLLLAHHVTVPVIPFPPNLGGHQLIQDYLIPSHIANAFILMGLVYSVRNLYRRAFVFFGVATLFHVVNSFWISVTVGLCIVVIEAGLEIKNRNFELALKSIPWDAAIIYGMISSPVVVPLLISTQSSSVGFEAVYITAWIRHPHHYLLSKFSGLTTIVTILFVLIGIILLHYFQHMLFADNTKKKFVFTYAYSLIAVFLFGGYVFTEVIPFEIVIQLIPFRVDDFLYLVLYGGVAKLVVVGLSEMGDRTSYDPVNFSVMILCGIMLIGVIGWGGGLALAQSGAEIGPISGGVAGPDKTLSEIYVQTPPQDDNLETAYDWIESETPTDVIFLASPSQSRFRLGSSRARVVNFKSFPFGSESAVEWEQRMNAVCNAKIRQFETKGFNIQEQCGERFNNMTQKEATNVAESYNASWILTKNSEYDFPRRHSVGEYHIYQIE
jgi:hypothetical protein